MNGTTNVLRQRQPDTIGDPLTHILRTGARKSLAFFDWPAEQWIRLPTTNTIESVFATVRHRTARTKGSLLPTTARPMGENQLPKVIAGVEFQDGSEVIPVLGNSAA